MVMMMMFDHQFDQSDYETEYDNDDELISDACVWSNFKLNGSNVLP